MDVREYNGPFIVQRESGHFKLSRIGRIILGLMKRVIAILVDEDSDIMQICSYTIILYRCNKLSLFQILETVL